MTYKEQIEEQKKSIININKKIENLNKSSLSQEEILQNEKRNNEILNYNNSKYVAKNNFLLQFIVAYGILIIFSALIYGKLIPSFIGEPIAILYGTLVSLYLLGVHTDISIRSKRYFNKYNFMKHDTSKNSSSSASEKELQCIGDECCPEGTTFNKDENICIIDKNESDETDETDENENDRNDDNTDDETQQSFDLFKWMNNF